MHTFYVTTPIYYANSLPHLGHLYTTVAADVIQRFKKQRGFETLFLTGTDEHGLNIERAARKAGRTPQEQVDYVSAELKRMFERFRLDSGSGGYDIFMRTTAEFHYAGAQALWRAIAQNKTPKGNDTIYKGFYQGWFCAACAEFKTDEQIYTPVESPAPYCTIHERPVDKIAEESYFFRLSDYGDFLIELLEGRPQLVRPDARRNEVLSFVRGGLQDLSISRLRSSVSWGVPVPDDDAHVMYVWLDALSNYITALGYGSGNDSGDRFDKFWPSAVHLVGKDILRFHTVYWFSFLHAAKIDPPTAVFAHGMWLDADGRKMGKTLGNVINVDDLAENFQTDAIRYFMMREMVFGQDGKFGYDALIERTNADLAGGLGNLAARTLTMIAKFRGGLIPNGKISEPNYLLARRAGLDPDGQDLVSVLEHARDEFLRRFENFDFSVALETLWQVITRVDKMISDAKPWNLAKDDAQNETLNAVLYRAAESLRWLAVLLNPIMPSSSADLYKQLGIDGSAAAVDPASLRWGELASGAVIGNAPALFPRIERNNIMQNINKSAELTENAADASVADAKVKSQASDESVDSADDTPYISIDDFLKVDLRVGRILTAERVPNADKLLKFEIDLGEDAPRQILAGLAEFYDPAKLIGRQVVVVANLKPRKMRGFESQGMICAASLADGDVPALATFTDEVSVGARLK